jgi:hypothetical protein
MSKTELLQIADGHLRSVRKFGSLIITDLKAGNVEIEYMADLRKYKVRGFNTGLCILLEVSAAKVKNWLIDQYVIETIVAFLQQEYIDTVNAGIARWSHARRGHATRKLKKELKKLGFDDASCLIAVQDARDVAKLERNAAK